MLQVSYLPRPLTYHTPFVSFRPPLSLGRFAPSFYLAQFLSFNTLIFSWSWHSFSELSRDVAFSHLQLLTVVFSHTRFLLYRSRQSLSRFLVDSAGPDARRLFP